MTDLLRRLLSNFKLPESAIAVDSDPRRRTHLEDEGILVQEPKDCIEHIEHSELLVICAPRYQAGILAWVARETGRTFAAESLAVLGNGPSGEALS